MKYIIKRITARLAKTPATNTEREPERVVEIDTEQVFEQVVQQIQMRTLFPHQPVLSAGDTYSDWYARVAGVWQRRRQVDMQAAPTDDLQRVIQSVMRMRLETAQEAATTLH